MVRDSLNSNIPSSNERTAANNEIVAKINTLEECMEAYKGWADFYDEDLNPARYRGPEFVARVVDDLYPDTNEKAKIALLDVAAGTGWVGWWLHQMGFKHMDALDPSEDMLGVLRKKGFYRQLYKEAIHGLRSTTVPDASYDVVTMSGAFIQGHVPVTACDEMARYCKPGGYIVISMRQEFLHLVEDYHKLEPHMAELEQRGVWKRVSREVRQNFILKKPGVVFVFQKC